MKKIGATKNGTNAPPGVTRRPYNIKHGRHSFVACTCRSYIPDLDKSTVGCGDISIPSLVEYHVFFFP